MGCTWFGIFMLLTTDSPDDHRFISKEEKEYLKETTQTNSNDTRNKKTPWLQIFTSKSCIAIFVRLVLKDSYCCLNFSLKKIVFFKPFFL